MAKTAFLFPGQGSQSVGMGQALADYSEQARQIFQAFDRIVSPQLTQVCFNGPEEELRRTLYTQPAILATSLAALAVFQQELPLTPNFAAGHSLGEYGALYAAGVLDLETAAQLVKKRAELMENAPEGAMSAVLGLPETQVEKVMMQVKILGQGPITIANYNTGEQSVISGAREAIAAAEPLLKEAGAKRVLALPVGGAFHSPLMDQAANEFAEFLKQFHFKDAAFPVITNVDAQQTIKGPEFQQKLGEQINHSVRWTQTMQRLCCDEGVTTVIEFGPGKVLTGMVKKMYPDVRFFNVFDPASLEATLESMNQPAMV